MDEERFHKDEVEVGVEELAFEEVKKVGLQEVELNWIGGHVGGGLLPGGREGLTKWRKLLGKYDVPKIFGDEGKI